MHRYMLPPIIVIATLLLLAQALPLAAEPQSYAVPKQFIVLGELPEIQNAVEPLIGKIATQDVKPMPWFAAVSDDHPLGARSNVQMNLFSIEDPDLSVVEALTRIEETEAFVYTSPNWVTASTAPWYIEGAPGVPPSVISATAPITTQTAFTQIGYSDDLPADGSGVKIGMLDTSPYDRLNNGVFDADIQGIALRVHHNYALPQPSPVTPTVDLAEHGTAVVALSAAIAPAADYHLLRVFNRGGVGDLFVLNSALSDFLGSSISEIQNDDIKGAIVNLSLVVHAPPSSVALPLHAVLSAGSSYDEILIVAAAGNEADDADVFLPRLPARYPYVLAVAGANESDARSCFSHSGQIGAPAGDTLNAAATCEPPTMTQKLRTLSVTPGQQIEWAGTSFATPLVSGAAALLLDHHDGAPATDSVPAILLRSARDVADEDLGAGILNLPGAISEVPLAVEVSRVEAAAPPIYWSSLLLLVSILVVPFMRLDR